MFKLQRPRFLIYLRRFCDKCEKPNAKESGKKSDKESAKESSKGSSKESGKESDKKTDGPKFEKSELKTILEQKIIAERERVAAFRKVYGKCKIGEYTVNSVYGGMRGIMGLLCDTSSLHPDNGITFRGHTIDDLKETLPKAEGGAQPLAEGIFWLMLTGEIPTDDQVKTLSHDLAKRSILPAHVCSFLDSLPKHVHPMSQLSAANTILNTESVFTKAYNERRLKKTDSWEYIFEDAMNLIAKQIVIAAKIYQNTYKNGASIGTLNTCRDWSQNLCLMLGKDDPEFIELMRLYLTIHSDHESGNVSSHAIHLVHSTLSDPYLSFAAGLNGLAGPLHGLANQEVLSFIEGLVKEIGESPSEEDVKKFCEKTLNSGQVIPGYGHAVLRKTDPRFTCQYDFAQEYMPDDPLVKVVAMLLKVVPPILQGLGKVQNPWPNVDAHSGVLLKHYGLNEPTYYTVLFGVSRCLGTMASIIWHRALGTPIERPKSVTTDELMKLSGADEADDSSDDSSR